MKRKIMYLAFCEKCGYPKKITIYAIRIHWKNNVSKYEHCSNCHHYTKIPECLQRIAIELVREAKWNKQ
jgi:ribosomal protein L32